MVLDGRVVKTPARAVLALPAEALAGAVAAEWAAQGENVRPKTMPLNQIAATALDRVAPRRAEAIDEIAGYAASDLLCHRAEAPPELVGQQDAGWQPLVDWAAATLGGRLKVTTGILPIEQPAAALAACRGAVESHDDMGLAALAVAAAACGSLILALALSAGRIDSVRSWELSQLDESFQIARWGEDAEAAARRAEIRADIEAAARFLTLLRGSH